jgi:transposase-like protein
MREYRERFSSRKACLEYLVKARWPEGFVCPHCQHVGGWLKEDRFLYRCGECKRDTSPTAGTAMHRSKIPIQDWFWAAYMVATHTPGLSAKQLQRYLGTSSYETAWYLLQRFRRAMVNDNRTLLSGTVEADETLVGGPAKGEKGRGVARGKNKSLVLGMVEVLSYKDASGKAKKRAGRVRLEVAKHADEETIRIFLDKNLKPGSKVQTDGWRGYSETALLDYRHVIKVQDSPQSASRLAPHVHRVFSNLKTWLMGTHHGVEPKYLQAYLDEFVFRFNRRQTPMAAFQTLLGITAVKTPATKRKIQSGYSTG